MQSAVPGNVIAAIGQGKISNLNLGAGETVAGSVTTKLGSGASVRLRNDAGSVHLAVDLAGYYVSGGSGAGFTATTPSRVLDTRTSGTPRSSHEAGPKTRPGSAVRR